MQTKHDHHMLGQTASNSIASYLSTLCEQVPIFPHVGFGFWICWNMLSFSGLTWFEETSNSLHISDFLMVHLVFCVITLLVCAFAQSSIYRWVQTPQWVLVSVIASVVGEILIIVARPSILGSLGLFIAGGLATGLGTTLVFIRSLISICAHTPRKAFLMLCEILGFGVLLFLAFYAFDQVIRTVLYICLPVVAGICLAIKQPSSQELALCETKPLQSSAPLYRFLAAVFVYSLSAQILASSIFPQPFEQTLDSYSYASLIIIVSLLVFCLLSVSSTSFWGFGKIYMYATFAIICLLVIAPLFNIAEPYRSTLSFGSNYILNILVWSMLGYIAYQTMGNTIRIITLGNAALAFGTIVGNALVILLRSLPISVSYAPVFYLLAAIVALLVSVFVFPESKINDLLLPVIEPEVPSSTKNKRPWIDACGDIAERSDLTSREREVFISLAKGKTTEQISHELVISPYTTRAHIRNIYSKLSVHSRTELAELVSSELRQGK